MNHNRSGMHLFAVANRFFFCLSCFWAPCGLFAGEWEGVVTRVVDGDTLVVSREGQPVRIRLAGVDAPEHGQPGYGEAKAFVESRIGRQRVRVHEKEADRYGRLVAWVTLPGREEVGSALVRAGLAWRHKAYSRDPNLIALERAARQRGLGLWSQPDPVPPWVWKRQHRSQRE